jgi:hypothetical protein
MTYHSLIDIDEGYIEGSEIVFGDVSLRYYDKAKKFKLQKVDFIDVISIPPTDRYFLEASWKLQTGFEQRLEEGDEHLAAYINPGGGMAFQFDYLGKIFFLAEVDIYGGPSFNNNYFVGPGGSTGIVNNICSYWKLYAYINSYYYAVGDKTYQLEAGITQRFKITNNINLVFDYTYLKRDEISWNEYLLRVNFFF